MYRVWELSLGVSLVEDPKSWTFYWHLHSFQLSENQEYILDSNLILLRFETSNFPRCPLSYGDVTSSRGTYSGRTWSLERHGCTCMLLIDQSKGVRTDVGHTHSSCVFSSSRMCVLLNWLWELECCDDLCNRVALSLSLSVGVTVCLFGWHSCRRCLFRSSLILSEQFAMSLVLCFLFLFFPERPLENLALPSDVGLKQKS